MCVCIWFHLFCYSLDVDCELATRKRPGERDLHKSTHSTTRIINVLISILNWEKRTEREGREGARRTDKFKRNLY